MIRAVSRPVCSRSPMVSPSWKWTTTPLELKLPVYDALYAWARSQIETTGLPSAARPSVRKRLEFDRSLDLSAR